MLEVNINIFINNISNMIVCQCSSLLYSRHCLLMSKGLKGKQEDVKGRTNWSPENPFITHKGVVRSIKYHTKKIERKNSVSLDLVV